MFNGAAPLEDNVRSQRDYDTSFSESRCEGVAQKSVPLRDFECNGIFNVDQRTRVMSCTQFVSQVLPSSGESACSQWHDVGVILDQMKRA